MEWKDRQIGSLLLWKNFIIVKRIIFSFGVVKLMKYRPIMHITAGALAACLGRLKSSKR